MVRRRSNRAQSGCYDCGQASLLMLGVVGAVLAGAVVLFAFGNALGTKGRYQRAADLAAIGAAQVMRDRYPRLFEPPFIEPDVPNPRHLDESEYRVLAIAAAIRGARRNGVHIGAENVTFPGSGFAPTRVTVRVRGEALVSLGGEPRAARRVPVRAAATAELSPAVGGNGLPAQASGGGYDGPLAYRQGKPMPHLFPADGVGDIPLSGLYGESRWPSDRMSARRLTRLRMLPPDPLARPASELPRRASGSGRQRSAPGCMEAPRAREAVRRCQPMTQMPREPSEGGRSPVQA